MIIATHDLGDLADIADRCYVLEAGRLAAEGSPDEILRRIAASQELVNQMQHTTINSSPIH